MANDKSQMANRSVNPNGENTDAVVATPRRRPSNVWLIIVAALFIVVPFLTWYLTWFGRDLSDAEIAKYLADEKSPRHIQHALSQIETRIEQGDASVKKFYPQIISVSKSQTGEIRKTAAWVMGQDNSSPEFRQALVALLDDAEPLVRRNAALQLVRFGDPSGRRELRAMLGPYEVKSPMSGTLVSLLPEGSKVKAGGLLGRIRDLSGAIQDFRSPLDGTIGRIVVKEGEQIAAGRTVLWLTPDRATINDALHALAYAGTKEDLPLIESFSQGAATNDAEIKQQAALTARAIRARADQ
jgi:biotin carboxyl carrier protein